MKSAAHEDPNPNLDTWLDALGPSQEQLDRSEQQIMLQLSVRVPKDGLSELDTSLSLTAEWAALLSERPIANTLLAAAAAATLVSLPLAAAASAVKLWLA